MIELLNGRPLFCGSTSLDMLTQVMAARRLLPFYLSQMPVTC